MPTIYELRCLNCGCHGHGKAVCPHSPPRRADELQAQHTNKGKQNDIASTEKPPHDNFNYGKEDVDLEIKAEESLMNY
jgi:hypothetical protein